MTDKEEHSCLHEKDFGVVFTKIDSMTDAFRVQTIAMEALKIAVDAAVKYQISMEAIKKAKDDERIPHLYKTAIIITSILAVCGIIVTLIIEYTN